MSHAQIKVVERLGSVIHDDLEFFKLFKNGTNPALEDDDEKNYKPSDQLN